MQWLKEKGPRNISFQESLKIPKGNQKPQIAKGYEIQWLQKKDQETYSLK